MKNKNIIKAMAIGISASMALAPVTAFAEEPNAGGTELSQGNQDSNTEAMSAAQEAVNNATSTDAYVNGDVKAAVDAVKDKSAEVSENDFSKTVNAEVNSSFEGLTENADNTKKAVDSAQNSIVEDVNKLKDSSNKIDNGLTDADKALEGMKNTSESIKTVVETADESIDAANKAIKGAGNKTAAIKAYEDALQIATDAQEAYDAASLEYAAYKKDYDAAVASVKEAQAAFDSAMNASEEKLAEAKRALTEAQKNADDLKSKAEKASQKLTEMYNASVSRQGEVTKLYNELIGAQKEKAKEIEDLSNEITGLGNQLTNLGSELESKKNTKIIKEGELSNLESDISTLEGQIASLETTIGRAGVEGTDATGLNKELEELRGQLNGKISEKSTKEGEISGLDTAISGIDAEIKRIEGQLGNDGADGKESTGLYKTLEENRSELAGINVIIGNDGKDGKDKTGLNKDVADKESELSVAGADLKDKQEELVRLKEQYNDLTSEAARNALQKAIDDAKDALDAAKERLDRAQLLTDAEAADGAEVTAWNDYAENAGDIASQISGLESEISELQSTINSISTNEGYYRQIVQNYSTIKWPSWSQRNAYNNAVNELAKLDAARASLPQKEETKSGLENRLNTLVDTYKQKDAELAAIMLQVRFADAAEKNSITVQAGDDNKFTVTYTDKVTKETVKTEYVLSFYAPSAGSAHYLQLDTVKKTNKDQTVYVDGKGNRISEGIVERYWSISNFGWKYYYVDKDGNEISVERKQIKASVDTYLESDFVGAYTGHDDASEIEKSIGHAGTETEEASGLNKALEDARKNKSDKEAEAARLNNDISGLQTEITDLADAIGNDGSDGNPKSGLHKSIADLRERIEEEAGKKERLESTIGNLLEQIESLQDRLEKKDGTGLKKDLVDKQNSLSDAQRQLSAINATLGNDGTDGKEKTGLYSAVAAKEQELFNANTELQTKSETLEGYEGNKSALEGEIEGLGVQIGALSGQIAEIEAAVTEKSGLKESTEKEKSVIDGKVDDADKELGKLADAQKQYDFAKGKYDALVTAATEAQKKATATKESISALESAISAMTRELVIGDKSINLDDAKLEALEKALETARANLEDAENTYGEIGRKVSEAKENLMAKERALEAARRRNEALNNDTSSNDDDDVIASITPLATVTPSASNVASEAEADAPEVLGAKRPSASKAAAAKTDVNSNAKADSTKTAATITANNTNSSSNAAVADETDKVTEEKEVTENQAVADIADEAVAKAATPIESQKGFPYWVLIILAAAAGVSVEEYVRRKKN